MYEQLALLENIEPTEFVESWNEFWAGALYSFKKNLPQKHIKNVKSEYSNINVSLISVEAAKAFNECVTVGKIKINI